MATELFLSFLRSLRLVCRLLVVDAHTQALTTMTSACLVFTVMLIDPYGYEGWFSRTDTEMLHNFAVCLNLLGAIATTFLFASIMAAFHPRTRRVLVALKLLLLGSLFVFVLTTITYLAARTVAVRSLVVSLFGIASALVILVIVLGSSIYTIAILTPDSRLESTWEELNARRRMRVLVRVQQATWLLLAFWGIYPFVAPNSIADSPSAQVSVVTFQWVTLFIGAMAFLKLLGRGPHNQRTIVPVLVQSSPVPSTRNGRQPLTQVTLVASPTHKYAPELEIAIES